MDGWACSVPIPTRPWSVQATSGAISRASLLQGTPHAYIPSLPSSISRPQPLPSTDHARHPAPLPSESWPGTTSTACVPKRATPPAPVDTLTDTLTTTQPETGLQSTGPQVHRATPGLQRGERMHVTTAVPRYIQCMLYYYTVLYYTSLSGGIRPIQRPTPTNAPPRPAPLRPVYRLYSTCPLPKSSQTPTPSASSPCLRPSLGPPADAAPSGCAMRFSETLRPHARS